MPRSQVSLGLVVRNEASQLRAALDNIKQVAGSTIHEIVMVDNCSEDETSQIAQSWRQENPEVLLTYIRNTENNMASARNLVLQKAASAWVYFTDADCRLVPQNWERFLRSLNSDYAAFGGGNITPNTGTFVSRGLQHMALNPLGHMGAVQASPPQKMRVTKFLSTSNMLVSKEAALACGGFDEAYVRVGEDLSLCHRLTIYNHKICAVPQVEVLHLQDRGLWAWCEKMISYGRAQVFVGLRYPRHFCGLRGIQFVAVWIFFILLFAAPAVCVAIAISYLIILLALTRWQEKGALQGVAFIALSHACYAMGELSGTLTGLIFVLKNFPTKIPVLEKQ